MNVYVARQPIFDKKQNVFAYELLYRKGANNFYSGTNGDTASSSVIIDSLHVIGLDTLTNGKKAFINFTDKLLKQEIATILPKDIVVIEILEDVFPDEEIIENCKNLKSLGYKLALDDFIFKPEFWPLINIVDIIKIDFMISSKKEIEDIIRRIGLNKIKFLAEKIETIEEFKFARDLGFTYFQGYFFSKPVIISAQDISPNKLNYLQLINKINEVEPDFKKIQEIVERDVSLSYKLLRLVNSAAFAFRKKIESIKQALVILGTTEMRKWVSLIALRGIGDGANDEVLQSSLLRGKFAESLSGMFNLKSFSSELFLMGLFSMIDVLMNRPLDEILLGLPISKNVKEALLGEENTFGNVMKIVLAYEKGEWDNLAKYIAQFGLNEDEVAKQYLESLKWMNNIII